MKKTLLLLISVLCLSMLFSACRILAPEPTGTPTPTATATHTASPTVTLTPTVTFTPTSRPTATQTVQPTATLEPWLESLKQFTNDDNKIAMLYPQDVEIVHAPETAVRLLDSDMGFTANVPADGLLYHATMSGYPAVGNHVMNLNNQQSFSLGVAWIEAEYNATVEEAKSSQISSMEDLAEEYGEITHSDGEYVVAGLNKGYFHFIISRKDDLVRYDISLVVLQEFSEDYDLMLTLQLLQPDVTQSEAQRVIEESKDNLISYYESYAEAAVYESDTNTPDYYVFTGICPTSTDETLGFSLSNPIYIAPDPDYFIGSIRTTIETKVGEIYLNSLLYHGQPIEFEKTGDMPTLNGDVDVYQITAPDLDEPIRLYLQAQTPSPYMVPYGFDCTGMLYPDYLLALYEELTKDYIDS